MEIQGNRKAKIILENNKFGRVTLPDSVTMKLQ